MKHFGIFGGLLQAIIHYIDKERPSCILNYVKNSLFSAETQRKIQHSAGYRNFFAIFAADFNKITVIMIIGREKEQRELLGLFDKEESYIRIPHEIGYICRKFS